jgi:hypothetical protein
VANQRIKGQEVSVSVVADGEEQLFTDINGFELMSDTETKEEGYLGETGNRFDEFYKGYSGNFKMHNSTGAVFTFINIIKDRAQRRTPGVVINIKATLAFPNGDRSRVMMNDAFFDAAGIAFAGRDAYGETTFNFKGSNFRVL